MKTKLFYLVLVILFTLTSCQKEKVLQDTLDTVNIESANKGPNVEEDLGCSVTCSYPYYFIVSAGVEIGTCEAYNGPLQNPVSYNWSAKKIHQSASRAAPIGPGLGSGSIIYTSTSDRINLPVCSAGMATMYYQVNLTISFDNGQTFTHYFCYNDYSDLDVCSGNQMGYMTIGAPCTGNATAALILP